MQAVNFRASEVELWLFVQRARLLQRVYGSWCVVVRVVKTDVVDRFGVKQKVAKVFTQLE